MTSMFEAMLRISVEAAVLCVLVLIARLIVGRRPGRLLTLLYALIAVRLIVPFAVSSPLSIHNIWNEPQKQLIATINDVDPIAVNDVQTSIRADTSQTHKTNVFRSAEQSQEAASGHVEAPADISPQTAAPLSVLNIAALIWTLGMITLSGTILTGNALFMRRLRRNRTYDEPHFLTLLDECKYALGLKQNIRVICASETGTAAVYGVFRPVLLISPASFELLTETQQRHVLLHELSHIRRRDTLICAGATVLNVVYWFNPLVWLVFALMRRDIEVQCDAHVFRGLPGAQRADYAETLLKLAGPVQTPKLAPALFISKANTKRRIVMIIKHKNKSALFTVVALLLTVIVAVTGCTTAVDLKAESAPSEPSPSAVIEVTPEATPTSTPEPSQPAAEPALMSTFTLDNSPAPYNRDLRLKNIQIAVDRLNGTVIKPSETISLNEILGPRNSETAETVGWTLASGITDGSYVTNIGGGMTAVSTALYNAAIRAELGVVDFSHCQIPYHLVDGGLDASISTEGPDLKIKNTYDSVVSIEAKLKGTDLIISIYGPHMDYTVDFYSDEIESKDEEPTTVYIYNATSASDGTEIDYGESYLSSSERLPVTYIVNKVVHYKDGSIKQMVFERYTYHAIKNVVYVNGPDPASVSEAGAEPPPAPTPMPSTKVKESNK